MASHPRPAPRRRGRGAGAKGPQPPGLTPWGEARGGDITQTTLDFTGQRKDGTGRLYYGARYYDPQLGRFLGADSIVPGMASGKSGMAATMAQDGDTTLCPPTVDFHETACSAGLAAEDVFTQARGFWFQLSGQDRRQAKVDTGPSNPQALNRYGYVPNNPLPYTDPIGHNYLAEGKTYVNEHSACQRGERYTDGSSTRRSLRPTGKHPPRERT